MPPAWLSALLPGQNSRNSVSASGRLCSICSKFDFEEIFEVSTTYPLKWSARIPVNHIRQHPGCPFCRMIMNTMLATHPLTKDSNQSQFKQVNFDDYLTDDQGRLCLERDREHSWYDYRTRIRSYVPHITFEDSTRDHKYSIVLLPSDTSADPSNYLRGRIRQPCIPTSLVKDWIQICEQSHGRNCSAGERSAYWNANLRLIDVKEKCVVKKSQCRYLALSYVWGTNCPQLKLEEHTSARLFAKGGLSGHHLDIPTTIRDAILFCEQIGERYLWVDSLCIFQDSPEDQAVQISSMQDIYANSTLTVISTSGESSWAGLPGISPRSLVQAREFIGDIQVTHKLADLREVKRASKWATRAWTMQEEYFSRRLIYFTDSQVYFQCDGCLWFEDRVHEAKPYVELCKEDSGRIVPISNQRMFKAPVEVAAAVDYSRPYNYHLHNFHNLLKSFLRRDITNPDDILNAFSGIISSFCMVWGKDGFSWGLPIMFFSNELLFTAANGGKRIKRPAFPTWSWSGWQKPQDSDAEKDYLDLIDWHNKIYTPIKFFSIVNSSYRLIPISGARKHCTEKASMKNKLVFERWFRSAPLPPVPIPDFLTKSEKSKLLVFQTSSIILTMSCSKKKKQYGRQRWSCKGCAGCLGYDAGATDRNSTARQDEEIIQLNSIITESDLEDGKMEFVIMSIFDNFDGVQQEEEYLVMAIKSDARGISERIEVPKSPITRSKWFQCGPKTRTVFLL